VLLLPSTFGQAGDSTAALLTGTDGCYVTLAAWLLSNSLLVPAAFVTHMKAKAQHINRAAHFVCSGIVL